MTKHSTVWSERGADVFSVRRRQERILMLSEKCLFRVAYDFDTVRNRSLSQLADLTTC